jgi:hypothetical protein
VLKLALTSVSETGAVRPGWPIAPSHLARLQIEARFASLESHGGTARREHAHVEILWRDGIPRLFTGVGTVSMGFNALISSNG